MNNIHESIENPEIMPLRGMKYQFFFYVIFSIRRLSNLESNPRNEYFVTIIVELNPLIVSISHVMKIH